MLLAPDVVFTHIRSKCGISVHSGATVDAVTSTFHNKAMQSVELDTADPFSPKRHPQIAAKPDKPIQRQRIVKAAPLTVPPSIYLTSKFDAVTGQVIIDDGIFGDEPAPAPSRLDVSRPAIELVSIGDQEQIVSTVQRLLNEAENKKKTPSQLVSFVAPTSADQEAIDDNDNDSLKIDAAEQTTRTSGKKDEQKQKQKEKRQPDGDEAFYDRLTMQMLGDLYDTEQVSEVKLNQLVDESGKLDPATRPDFSSLITDFRDQLTTCDRDARNLNEDLNDLRALLGFCDMLSNLDSQHPTSNLEIDAERVQTIREVEAQIGELQHETEMRKRRAEIAERMKKRELSKEQREALLRRQKLARLVKGEPTADRVDVQNTFRSTVLNAERAARRQQAELVARQQRSEKYRDALQVKALSYANDLLDDAQPPASRTRVVRAKSPSPNRPTFRR